MNVATVGLDSAEQFFRVHGVAKDSMIRVARYSAGIVAVVLSGWSCLAYLGLGNIAEDRARGWNLYQMPARPTLVKMVYLVVALALPILSALLTAPPSRPANGSQTLWQRFWFRVVLSALGSALAAFSLALLTIALMDAGLI